MEKTKFYSYKNNQLARGCQLCVQGKKLVLFVSGLCPKKCWYCPLSEEKYKKDVQFANERPIISDEDLINEAKSMDAEGCGITGGDPLVVLDRTLHFIEVLKKNFGSHFHIHLYTSPCSLSSDNLLKLNKLDEIRLHPDLDNKKDWEKLELLKDFKGSKGIEIPCVPDKEEEIFSLIEFVKGKVDFVNLNELEVAHTPHNEVLGRGYAIVEDSYAVQGSLELGMKILESFSDMNIHFCTAQLKDRAQLGNRIKRQAKCNSHKFDIITPEGSLIRGAIYLEKPSFGYREELKKKDKVFEVKKLKKKREELCLKLKCSKKDIFIDEIKYRFLVSCKMVRRYSKEIKEVGLIPAIVEEYPTYDMFEIELDFLE